MQRLALDSYSSRWEPRYKEQGSHAMRKRYIQFPLDEQCAGSNHFTLSVKNDKHMGANRSAAASLLHLVEAGLEVGLRHIADGCEDAQDIEEAGSVVSTLQRANGVCFGQSSGNGRRDQRGREKRVRGRMGGAVHDCGVWRCCLFSSRTELGR